MSCGKRVPVSTADWYTNECSWLRRAQQQRKHNLVTSVMEKYYRFLGCKMIRTLPISGRGEYIWKHRPHGNGLYEPQIVFYPFSERPFLTGKSYTIAIKNYELYKLCAKSIQHGERIKNGNHNDGYPIIWSLNYYKIKIDSWKKHRHPIFVDTLSPILQS